MSANIIKGGHSHSIGVNHNFIEETEIKERTLKQVLNIKPILARGHMDHLIEFNPESDPPTLTWKSALLIQMQIGDLMMLKNLLENRMEEQQRTY